MIIPKTWLEFLKQVVVKMTDVTHCAFFYLFGLIFSIVTISPYRGQSGEVRMIYHCHINIFYRVHIQLVGILIVIPCSPNNLKGFDSVSVMFL